MGNLNYRNYTGPIEDYFFSFEYHVVDHCNLNCAGCAHAAPLADVVFRTPEAFEHDCRLLSKFITHAGIQILGGEPLLHPQLLDFCKIADKYFERVEVITNGILLPKLSRSFIDDFNNSGFTMRLSDYPIPNQDEIVKFFNENFNNTIYYKKDNMQSPI